MSVIAKYDPCDNCVKRCCNICRLMNAVEPKRGEWVQYYETTMDGETVAYGWECSLCGRWVMECEPFCHCGAYMKGIL